jgi:hypothetical protein
VTWHYRADLVNPRERMGIMDRVADGESTSETRRTAPGRCRQIWVLTVLLLASCAGGGPSNVGQVVSAPDDFATEFARGSGDGQYVYYALADSNPDWDSIAQAGVYICSENRPPLIPESGRAALASGAFLPNTLVAIAGDSAIAEGSETTLRESVGVERLVVSVPAALEGCTEVALEEMMREPGTLLMTDAGASFPEQEQLVQIVLE